MKQKHIFLLLFLLALCMQGCSDDKEILPDDADDNFITSVKLTVGEDTYTARIENQQITVIVPYTVSLNHAEAEFIYSASATILPDPASITNWDEERPFKVTSYHGDPRDYTYRVIKDEIRQEGEVTILSRADIDALTEKGVTVILGNLILGSDDPEATPLEDLKGLELLKEIKGALIIRNSYQGKDLSGIEGVTSIGGLQLGSSGSPSEALNGEALFSLPRLISIDGDVMIYSDRIQRINLPALTTIVGHVTIHSTTWVSTDLSALTSIAGDLVLTGYTEENTGSELMYVEIPSLETVSGKIEITAFPKLMGITFEKLTSAGAILLPHIPFEFETIHLPHLRTVEGDIDFTSNSADVIGGTLRNTGIKEIGMDQLESVGGRITLSGLTALTRLPDLSDLRQLGGLSLNNLQALTGQDLDIRHIAFGGDSLILANTPIHSVCGPEELDATLCLNGTYPEIKGISSLKDLYYYGRNNGPVTLPFATVEKNIHMYLQECTELHMPALKEVGGYFSVDYQMTALHTLQLPALRKVGGQLYIRSGNITSLSLASLEEVGTGTEIAYSDEESPGTIDLLITGLSELSFPRLKKVAGKGLAIQTTEVMTETCESIRFPSLEEVEGCLLLSGEVYDSGYSDWFPDQKLSQILLPNLKKTSAVKITGFSLLEDFSMFRNVVDLLSDETWTVKNCRYNPTYEEMKAGHYTQQ
ncbi:MAG: hypothetical protein LIP08_00660 [Bacteroides sp.]|nr:hypothetical protein [Bacteroides sp.]